MVTNRTSLAADTKQKLADANALINELRTNTCLLFIHQLNAYKISIKT
jgi:hypothetical protein